jgi:hypothetical protein
VKENPFVQQKKMKKRTCFHKWPQVSTIYKNSLKSQKKLTKDFCQKLAPNFQVQITPIVGNQMESNHSLEIFSQKIAEAAQSLFDLL